mgnify:FL=1
MDSIDISDPLMRREVLKTNNNPGESIDYIVTVKGRLDRLKNTEGGREVIIRYVPDRFILIPDSFSTYIGNMANGPWDSLEAIAVAILEDINNELVPRWVRITVNSVDLQAEDIPLHSVSMEDHQPHWENKGLINSIV